MLIEVAKPIARGSESGGVGGRGEIAERGMRAIEIVVANQMTIMACASSR